MIRLRGLWHRPAVQRRTVLRVGYVEARPWSYRAEHGVQGLDSTAVSLVARKMACAIDYQCRAPSQLADGLINGDYDIAIGGLLDPPNSDLVAMAVPHAHILAAIDPVRARCRRAFFPNVWWVRRRDFLLRYRIATTMIRWKLGMGGEHSISRYAGHRPEMPE